MSTDAEIRGRHQRIADVLERFEALQVRVGDVPDELVGDMTRAAAELRRIADEVYATEED
jgi:hypothetical protein